MRTKTKKKGMVVSNIQVRKETAAFWKSVFGAASRGITWITEEFRDLKQATLLEMKGTFTLGELKMIIDVMNGNGSVLAVAGSGVVVESLQLNVEDSFRLYPGENEKKWNVDRDTLLEKISSLSRWQAVCLSVFAAEFWSDEKAEIKDFCKILLPDEEV